MATLSSQLALGIAYCRFPGCLACSAFTLVLEIWAPVLMPERQVLNQ